MLVHKFGGTSVGNAGRIAAVADIILQQHDLDRSAGSIIVVSAMSGVTDQLIAGGWAAAEGRDREFREIKAGLLQRHLETAETLLAVPQRLEISRMIEDRLHDLERLYRSMPPQLSRPWARLG